MTRGTVVSVIGVLVVVALAAAVGRLVLLDSSQESSSSLATASNPATQVVAQGVSSTGSPDPLPPASITNHELVLEHEALACTRPKEPVNFEVFSAGAAPDGLPFTGTTRRCDRVIPRNGWAANYVNYSYGHCTIPAGQTGCAPPLAIQTWPACQRTMADYEYAGKPIPYKRLPNLDEAMVVEYHFAIERRIEVYTRDATIVIFANDPRLARRAVSLLRPQRAGSPPAATSTELTKSAQETLQPPSRGAMEGELQCQ